jgi:hypothetical protein
MKQFMFETFLFVMLPVEKFFCYVKKIADINLSTIFFTDPCNRPLRKESVILFADTPDGGFKIIQLKKH